MSKTVKDIGEQGLLAKLLPLCAADTVGDDAAVVKVDAEQSLVVTTDVLVDGVHFSEATTGPEDVGWRAAAANLSDIAAMGASPLGITVSLALTEDVPLNWVEKLYHGLNDCLQQYQTAILGGDVCRSAVVTVAITAFGQVLPERIIQRSAARPGDTVVATGFHGASRAGLELLLQPEMGRNLAATERQYLILAHQRPQPRLDVVEWLREQEPTRMAGMDSSDGLADAVVQICRCSGVGADLDATALPVPDVLTQLVNQEQALEWALYGGEDFELVLCLPSPLAEALVQRLGKGAAAIGKITSDRQVKLKDRSGKLPPRELTLIEGFQHF
ncbi:MAG: thiamine-phosphate kinase [Cyanophyceae cyanobacterium]